MRFVKLQTLLFWTLLGCVRSSEMTLSAEPPLTAEQKNQLEEAQSEMDIGRNMAGRILRLYGTHGDEGLTQYVNEVGVLVSRSSDFSDRRYMFEIYKSDSVNAFACPGGYILISLGAIKLAKSEAELAHILGHEITHVGKKHMLKALQKMNKEELDRAAAKDTEQETPETVLIRKRPEPEESLTGATLARYLTGNSAGFNVIKAAKAGMALMLEKGLGAELEFDADREGTRYAIQAGYHPKALMNFLCRIETSRGRPKSYCLSGGEVEQKPLTVLDKTHPKVPDRIVQIQGVLATLKADEIVGAYGKKRFKEAKKRLKNPEIGSEAL